MASARLWLALQLSALLVTVVYCQKDLCKGKKETCVPGQLKVAGTCVNVTGDTATCVANAHIENNWYYPKKTDLCSLGECFCYCVTHGYFFTVFIPTAETSDRVVNNQGQLVQKSGKCWCHNFAGNEWFNKKVPMQRCASKGNAILVKNGMTNKQRSINKKSFYNCAVVLPDAASRSFQIGAGAPPGASSLQMCTQKEKCYDSTKVPRGGKALPGMKNVAECYCKCFTKGYFFGGWTEASKTCNCFNRKMTQKAVGCSGAKMRVQLRNSQRKTNCCKAATEPPKPEGSSRSSPMQGGPPPLPGVPKEKPEGSSRSSPMQGGPPPLPGPPKKNKPEGSSRSSPMQGGPPPLPGLPKKDKPAGSSRSTPMQGGPPPLPGGPKNEKPKEPAKPTVGIADEPDFELPDDINEPNPVELLPPLDDTIDYIFYYPPYEDLPPEYLDPLVLDPLEEDPNWPEPNTDQPDDVTTFIIYLPWLEYPPESPQWPDTYLDWPWPDAPIVHVDLPEDGFPPPYEFPLPEEFGDPFDWEPEWDVPLDPLDWLWPQDPGWFTFPDLSQFLPSALSPDQLFWYS